MNLKHLKDRDLLSQTQQLVQNERQLLTQILHHLREVERRKLFSDLGYQSLFEYAVKELKYSEGQAGRRIQAMRLLKEFPELEKKIETGSLSLSNISQAQSYFRESKKTEPDKKLEVIEKLKVLESLENKSAREGQKILISMQPQVSLPRERQRVLTQSHTEMRFIMTEDVKCRLEELRSLLGHKGANMNFVELIDYMAQVSIHNLKVKKFGKKRIEAEKTKNYEKKNLETMKIEKHPKKHEEAKKAKLQDRTQKNKTLKIWKGKKSRVARDSAKTNSMATPTSELQRVKNHGVNIRKDLIKDRYISKAIQYQIWERDQGRCCKCGSQRNLNIDHVKPIALGGSSKPQNLRIFCFNCNQRQAIKVFGFDHIQQHFIK